MKYTVILVLVILALVAGAANAQYDGYGTGRNSHQENQGGDDIATAGAPQSDYDPSQETPQQARTTQGSSVVNSYNTTNTVNHNYYGGSGSGTQSSGGRTPRKQAPSFHRYPVLRRSSSPAASAPSHSAHYSRSTPVPAPAPAPAIKSVIVNNYINTAAPTPTPVAPEKESKPMPLGQVIAICLTTAATVLGGLGIIFNQILKSAQAQETTKQDAEKSRQAQAKALSDAITIAKDYKPGAGREVSFRAKVGDTGGEVEGKAKDESAPVTQTTQPTTLLIQSTAAPAGQTIAGTQVLDPGALNLAAAGGSFNT